MLRRIVFSNETPNDQGGVIPNESLDFSRYNLNPVILPDHNWYSLPLGFMRDIKLENGNWTGVPEFHKITEESRTYAKMYEEGFLKACSIGGLSSWKKTSATGGTNMLQQDKDSYELDKAGNRICDKFVLYEISLVTLPSNPKAVQLNSVRNYEENEILNIENNIAQNISKLQSDLKSKTIMKNDKTKANNGTIEETVEPIAPEKESTSEKTKAESTEQQAEPNKEPRKTHVILESGMPSPLDKILGAVSDMASTIKKLVTPVPTHDEPDGDEPPISKEAPKDNEQPTPIGLSVKDLEKKLEKAEGELKEKKAKYESEEDEEEKGKILEGCHQIEAEIDTYKKQLNEAKEKEEKPAEKPEEVKQQSTNEITTMKSQPIIKNVEEMKEETKLAPKPQDISFKEDTRTTFSSMMKDKGEGERILMRTLSCNNGEKSVADYAAVLGALLRDPLYAELLSKVRIISNVTEGSLPTLKTSNPAQRVGRTLGQIYEGLKTGVTTRIDRSTNQLKSITTLSSSDDVLATPDTIAVEWLPFFIFKLFPKTSWKRDIPIMAANVTPNNLGVIWTNIAADPQVYVGTQPTTPANYSVADDAVSLKLTPFWLQPMLWTPLTMHQLRYDQMSTQWAQGLAKLNSVMDDTMIYNLASLVPAASIVYTTGGSFNIGVGNTVDAPYYNPTLTGNFAKPVLNDIVTIEQIYNKQNFNLDQEKAVIVLDPCMDSYLAKDPTTQSKLTRWIPENEYELLRFKHTDLYERSRVAIWDPATSAVIDPSGVIPATAQSAALGFIPSQVGIGLGMLDVFMIQDPTSYGYKMSCDIRIGAKWLRKNYNGGTLYTYGTPNV